MSPPPDDMNQIRGGGDKKGRWHPHQRHRFPLATMLSGSGRDDRPHHRRRYVPHSPSNGGRGAPHQRQLPSTLLISKSGRGFAVLALGWQNGGSPTTPPATLGDPWIRWSTPSSYGIAITPSGDTLHGKPGVASPPPPSSAGNGASGSTAGSLHKPSYVRSASAFGCCVVARRLTPCRFGVIPQVPPQPTSPLTQR